jgi:signal transduction histidine kinase
VIPTVSEQKSPAFEAMSDAVLAVAAERSVDSILQKLVHAARVLASARFAALGVPDGEGAFAQFITSGMSDKLVAALGPLPRTHGLLGAMLESERPYRTVDIRADPRFRGWWPRAHPQMRSFLGVPIVSRSGVIGAFYLTEKEGADEFDETDQELIEMLAAHAAIAIENARLYEQSRELSIVEERNRLARELHDSVTQTLFGLVLSAESAATFIERESGEARAEIGRLQALAQEALDELRSLVFELRPGSVEHEGLATALRKHVDVLRRVYRREIGLELRGSSNGTPEVEREVLRIAQEALQNALRHARAETIEVRLESGDGRLQLAISDDGIGFEPAAPALRSRRLGLTSMEERAEAIGGALRIESRPGAGTTIDLEVP